MNGHVDCGQLAHGSISCRRNTWGHHQQRARTVWLGNARLRAEQGKSARVGGFKRELANHRLERRCTAASSVEEEGERIAVHRHRVVGELPLKNAQRRAIDIYAVMLL